MRSPFNNPQILDSSYIKTFSNMKLHVLYNTQCTITRWKVSHDDEQCPLLWCFSLSQSHIPGFDSDDLTKPLNTVPETWFCLSQPCENNSCSQSSRRLFSEPVLLRPLQPLAYSKCWIESFCPRITPGLSTRPSWSFLWLSHSPGAPKQLQFCCPNSVQCRSWPHAFMWRSWGNCCTGLF